MEYNAIEIVMLLFATIGPLKVTIVCASLTAKASPEYLKKISFRSVVTALCVCLGFVLVGEVILKLFKVSIPAFQIAGGIIVLLFSLDMVMGGKKGKQEESEVEETPIEDPPMDLAIYPLAIPLMASVSGMVTIVSVVSQCNDWTSLSFLGGVIFALMGLNYLCLRGCQFIVQALGPSVLQVIGKLMGVILAALAVELVLTGLIGLGLPITPNR